MKKTQRKKAPKAIAKKLSKKASRSVKKVTNRAKQKTAKAKSKARGLLGRAKTTLNDIKKKSSKSLHRAKDKVHATEEDIIAYVKANPVKSVSAVALTTLITGFLAWHYKDK